MLTFYESDVIIENSLFNNNSSEDVINIIKSKFSKPLIAIPSTYSKTYESELINNGFKIVIYANHFLRTIHPAMVNVAKMILKNQRSFEAEKKMSSIKEVINLVQ